jgi:hypothetical protein
MNTPATMSSWRLLRPTFLANQQQKGDYQMAFDLSQYISFNVFALIWVASMLAGLAFASRNDHKRK